MERWRSFFGSSGEDLWTVIDRAITIAAIDYPQELRVRRDAFAEKLFAPASHFSTANIADGPRLDVRVENLFGPNLCPLTSSIGERPGLTRSDGGTGASPESETKDVLEGQQKNPGVISHDSTVVANCKSSKEEVLTEESEESRQIREILVIKERIMNLDQTEETCLLALSQLENMNICVPALKATGIGKPVNGLRKHASRRVRSIAKRLVSFWKDVVDEWVTKKGDDFAAAFVDSGTSDINGNENGVMSPCENNRVMPANGTGSPKILDNRDDDLSAGSWQMNNSEHRHIVTKLCGASLVEERLPQSNFQICNPHMNSYKSDFKVHKDKWDHEITPLDREPNSRYGDPFASTKEKFECAGGGSKAALDCNGNSCNKLDAVHRSNFAHRPPDPNEAIQKQKLFNSKAGTDMKPKCTESAQELHRLEAAKRRLHENYQQAEKVKKQRTIQVVDMETAPTGPSTQPKYNSVGHHAKPGINTKKACPANIR